MDRPRAAALTIIPFALLLAANGCSRDREQKNEAVVTGDATVTAASLLVGNDQAISRLVTARCTRKHTCDRIKPEPSPEDAPSCQEELLRVMTERLDSNACPLGVDKRQLDECVRAVEDEACNSPLDSFERYVHCRRVELCPRLAP